MHSRITLTRRTSTLFAKHNVYTSAEMHSRMETQLEEYNKILHIEAMTMSDMVREEITPACIAFENELAGTVNAKQGSHGVTGGMEAGLLVQGFRADRGAVRQERSARRRLLQPFRPTTAQKARTLLPRCRLLRDAGSPRGGRRSWKVW